MEKYFFIIILIIVQITNQYKCIVKGDVYFAWGDSIKFENQTVLIIRTPIINGYSSITFHNDPNTFKNSITFFSNITLQNLKILTGDDFTKNFTRNETNIKGFVQYGKFPEYGDDYLGLKRNFMTIFVNDTSFFQNKKYLTIKYQEYDIENEFTLKFNFFKQFTCTLPFVDNIDFLHPSLTTLKGNLKNKKKEF
jgi:hypothetical protein